MISVASYRTPTTAFAPSWPACWSIRSSASRRGLSQRSVSRVILPPTRVWRPAPMVPKIERDRTIMPRTNPSVCTTSWPCSSNWVVVMLCWTKAISTLGHQGIDLLEHLLHAPADFLALLAQRDHFTAQDVQFFFAR